MVTITAIALTLTVLALVFIFSIGEWLPLDVVAILATGVLMVLGLVTPEEGISGFGNSATITVMSMFILSAGIARTGALQVVNDWLVRWGGRHPTRQIFTLGAIVGPVTAIINNTAVVAIFLPIVEEWCAKQHTSPSKLLIPLSYATILGGTITVIGTSTNILASGLSEQLGYGAFGVFQFTKLGLITFVIGLIYLSFASPRLLPDRKLTNGDRITHNYDLKHYISELLVTSRCALVGQTLGESCLKRSDRSQSKTFDVDVLEIIRNGVAFSHPLDRKRLRAGDVLVVRGSREVLLRLKEEKEIDILPEVEFGGTELGNDEEGLAETLIPANSRLIGLTLREAHFRQRYNLIVLAMRRGERLARERLCDTKLRFGDVLLLQGPKQSLAGLQANPDLLLLNQRDIDTARRDKIGLALAIAAGVVGVSALNLIPIVVSSLIGAVLMVVAGCLKPGELYAAVRWDIVFLLAGLIPLGIAMEKSGATLWLAEHLAAAGNHLSGYWIVTFFFVVTSLLTEVLSNNASVVLLIPIAAQVGTQLQLNPLALMFAVTFAASNSFMTPIGYQTNTMVYGPGGYKFLDFFRVGFPLNAIMALVTPPLIIWLYGLDMP